MVDLFPVVAFAIAFMMGFVTWVAKNVYRNKRLTQTAAAIAIIATLAFMYWALFESGL